jgi:hypothetical protein
LRIALASLERQPSEGSLNKPVGGLVTAAFLQHHKPHGSLSSNPDQERWVF